VQSIKIINRKKCNQSEEPIWISAINQKNQEERVQSIRRINRDLS